MHLIYKGRTYFISFDGRIDIEHGFITFYKDEELQSHSYDDDLFGDDYVEYEFWQEPVLSFKIDEVLEDMVNFYLSEIYGYSEEDKEYDYYPDHDRSGLHIKEYFSNLNEQTIDLDLVLQDIAYMQKQSKEMDNK